MNAMEQRRRDSDIFYMAVYSGITLRELAGTFVLSTEKIRQIIEHRGRKVGIGN